MERSWRRIGWRIGSVAVLICAAAGCATRTTAPGDEFLVSGYVHAGPTCPVARVPPDPTCADRPVGDASISISDAAGGDVGAVLTDAFGRFAVRLPAGVYTFTPRPVAGLMGTASPRTLTVGPVDVEELDFAYDTGIR